MDRIERLVQRVLEGIAPDETEEVALTGLSREVLENIAGLSDEEYEDFLTILEAELILRGRHLKDAGKLDTIRRALRLRRTRSTPLAEAFPELQHLNLTVPAGYTVSRSGVAAGGDLISTSPFFVAGRAKSRETGSADYRIMLLDEEGWVELCSACSRGPAGVVRAVAAAGVFVQVREAQEYVAAWLAQNWSLLQVTDADAEAAGAYELLVEMVTGSIEKFLAERWGRIFIPRAEADGVYLALPVGRFEQFLKRIGCQNRNMLLKAWRARGLLRTDAPDRFTGAERVNGVVQRCVVLRLPQEFASVVTGPRKRPVTPLPLSHNEKTAS
ncbi:MAG: hypothetical protein ACPLRW_06795 [Moorellales bacterium]